MGPRETSSHFGDQLNTSWCGTIIVCLLQWDWPSAASKHWRRYFDHFAVIKADMLVTQSAGGCFVWLMKVLHPPVASFVMAQLTWMQFHRQRALEQLEGSSADLHQGSCDMEQLSPPPGLVSSCWQTNRPTDDGEHVQSPPWCSWSIFDSLPLSKGTFPACRVFRWTRRSIQMIRVEACSV